RCRDGSAHAASSRRQARPGPNQEGPGTDRAADDEERRKFVRALGGRRRVPGCIRRRPGGNALAANSKTSFSPREGTRPTRFPPKSACIVGPVPSPGDFLNGLLARKFSTSNSSSH